MAYSPEGYVEIVWQGRDLTETECFPIHTVRRYGVLVPEPVSATPPKAKKKAA